MIPLSVNLSDFHPHFTRNELLARDAPFYHSSMASCYYVTSSHCILFIYDDDAVDHCK